MWYLILGHDRPGSLEARRTHRPAHLARLHGVIDANGAG